MWDRQRESTYHERIDLGILWKSDVVMTKATSHTN